MTRGKPRWKFSFRRSSTSSSSSSSLSTTSSTTASGTRESTPMEFVCPISSSLMADPVIVPSGQTFERSCIEACKEFSFTPPSLSSSSSSSFLLIPNVALKSAILNWCDRSGLPHPEPISQETARGLVQRLMADSLPKYDAGRREEDQDDAASPISMPTKNHPSCFSPPSSNSSSSCYSSMSSSSSSEIVIASDETPKSDPGTTTIAADPLEEEILAKLKNPQISEKESALISIRSSARESSDRRISLCTPRLLSAVVSMLFSRNSAIQINATAAIVNLSIEPSNKIKIVRSGAVPPLVDVLKCGHLEARDNAAGAIFSLALEEENRLAIGVLGAIPPLLHLFSRQAVSHRARKEAGMALNHLSLASNNLSKLVKTAGAVRALLGVATAKGDSEAMSLRRVAMMVLCNLAGRGEGRAALMDADAVERMVEMMREGAGKEEEYCLAVMYGMSKGSLRFRSMARAAKAEEVLVVDKEGRGEVGREMVRRTLNVIRGKEEEGGVVLVLGDEEEERSVVSGGGLVSFRRSYDEFGIGSGLNSM